MSRRRRGRWARLWWRTVDAVGLAAICLAAVAIAVDVAWPDGDGLRDPSEPSPVTRVLVTLFALAVVVVVALEVLRRRDRFRWRHLGPVLGQMFVVALGCAAVVLSLRAGLSADGWTDPVTRDVGRWGPSPVTLPAWVWPAAGLPVGVVFAVAGVLLATGLLREPVAGPRGWRTHADGSRRSRPR